LRVEERPETGLGGRVRLRPTGEGDLGFVLREEGDEENRPFIGRWTRGRHLEALADEDVEHLISEDGGGAPVGYAILTGVRDPGRILCLKRLMVAQKGQGYGRTVLRLVKERSFGSSRRTASGSTSRRGTRGRGASTNPKASSRRVC